MTKEFSNEKVNIADEKSNIVDLIMQTWGVDNKPIEEKIVIEVVDYYFEFGYESAKLWLNYSVQDKYFQLQDERENFIEKDLASTRISFINDAVWTILNEDFNHFHQTSQKAKGELNYDEQTDLARKSGPKLPDNFSPNRWYELIDQYEDYDWLDDKEWDHSDLFKGYNTMSASGGYNIHERINLPNVMYDETNQGRNRFHVITGAIFSHALFCRQHDNSLKIIEFVENFWDKYGKIPFHAGDLKTDLSLMKNYNFSDPEKIKELSELSPLPPLTKKEKLEKLKSALERLKNHD